MELMELNERDRETAAVKQTTPSAESTEESQQPEQKKAKLEEVDYQTLKTEVNKKRDRMRNVPKLRLKEVGQEALMKTKPEDRVPLLMDDVQALLMHTLLRTDSPMSPGRWVALEKSAKLTHTTVLLVEGLTSDDFAEFEHEMPECKKIFQHILQVVAPSDRLVEELACVPLSDTHKDILLAEYGSLEAAMLGCKDHLLIRRSIFNNIAGSDAGVDPDYSELDLPPGDKFPRTQLLLSPIQMINEDYPLPLTGESFIRQDCLCLHNSLPLETVTSSDKQRALNRWQSSFIFNEFSSFFSLCRQSEASLHRLHYHERPLCAGHAQVADVWPRL